MIDFYKNILNGIYSNPSLAGIIVSIVAIVIARYLIKKLVTKINKMALKYLYSSIFVAGLQFITNCFSLYFSESMFLHGLGIGLGTINLLLFFLFYLQYQKE